MFKSSNCPIGKYERMRCHCVLCFFFFLSYIVVTLHTNANAHAAFCKKKRIQCKPHYIIRNKLLIDTNSSVESKIIHTLLRNKKLNKSYKIDFVSDRMFDYFSKLCITIISNNLTKQIWNLVEN